MNELPVSLLIAMLPASTNTVTRLAGPSAGRRASRRKRAYCPSAKRSWISPNRGAISRNLFVLGNVQQEVQAANRRAQERIGKGQPITPGSKENIEFDREMNDYLDRPCKAELDHLSEADLKVDENDLPGTVLSALWKILDR